MLDQTFSIFVSVCLDAISPQQIVQRDSARLTACSLHSRRRDTLKARGCLAADRMAAAGVYHPQSWVDLQLQ